MQGVEADRAAAGDHDGVEVAAPRTAGQIMRAEQTMATRPQPAVISLPVFDGHGNLKVHEELECLTPAEGVFHLVHSPGLAEGLAAGDEIRLQEGRPGYKVLRRGGNLCLWFFTTTATVDQDRERAAPELVDDVKALGGYLDGGTRRSLVFTIPVRVGFANIEKAFEKAKAKHPGSVWLYGNVYDPVDGVTPLNWWP